MGASTDWRGRTVLVPGASGFLGTHLCRRLVDHGADVVAVSRSSCQPAGDSIRWLQADLGDLDAVRRLLRSVRPDVVFHLSGCITASPGLEYVLPTFDSLVRSTVHLLIAVAETGCRRIIVPGSLTEPEGTALCPGSPYAAAKVGATMYARLFYELYRTPVVVPRIFMTYGPGQSHRKIIPYVIHCLLRDEPPKLTEGRWQLDWVYVDDVIEGLLAAGVRPGIEGTTFDLGTGTVTAVRDIVDRLLQLIPTHVEPLFGSLPDRPCESARVANVTETSAILGWRASTALSDGLKQTVDWYRHVRDRGEVAGTRIDALPAPTVR